MSRRWPTDFKEFKGDFPAFVEACREASQSAIGDKGVSDGLVRHYQQNGSVSRGTRTGRAAVYGFSEIAEVVATKAMVAEGWTVKNASTVIPKMGLPSLLNMIDKGKATATATAQVAIPKTVTSDQAPASAAMALVQSMLNRAKATSPALPAPAVQSYELPAMPKGIMSNAMIGVATTSQSVYRASLNPAPWMQVLVDSGALASLTPEDVESGLDSLRAQLSSLTPEKDTP